MKQLIFERPSEVLLFLVWVICVRLAADMSLLIHDVFLYVMSVHIPVHSLFVSVAEEIDGLWLLQFLNLIIIFCCNVDVLASNGHLEFILITFGVGVIIEPVPGVFVNWYEDY